MPMKKGMTVLTTFEPLYKRFHGLTCDHRHQHQPIEGSCRTPGGERVLRTRYTEVYPRKFARAVAQVMGKGSTCLPYGWTSDLAAVIAETSAEASPAFALQTKFRAKAEFPKSETVIPTARSAVDAKRSKTDSQQGFAPTLEMCQQAIQAISEKLPRVGKMEFWDSQIISLLQQVFPEKHVHAVMACRGTERTIMEATQEPSRPRSSIPPNVDAAKGWSGTV